MRDYSYPEELDTLFNSSSYKINQPFFQIFKEGYTIIPSNKENIFSAVRHRNILKVLLSTLMSVAVSFSMCAIIFYFLTELKAKS